MISNDPEFAMAVILEEMEKNPQARRYMSIFSAAMIPFEFHGQVVDEGGIPIENVLISYQIGFPYGYGYTEEQSVETGAEGKFVITGTGDSILILNAKKEYFGVSEKTLPIPEFAYGEGRGKVSWLEYNAANPFIIEMGPSPFRFPN